MIDNIVTTNVFIALCHEKNNYYHYPLHVYSHEELKDLKQITMHL